MLFYFSIIPVLIVTLRWFSWIHLKSASAPRKEQAQRLCVLVVARNEEERLPRLLECIQTEIALINQIIIADDSSEDRTPDIAEAFRVQNPGKVTVIQYRAREGQSPKKTGIEKAIENCDCDWIWMIDADTEIIKGGLASRREFLMSSEMDVVAGSVIEKPKSGTIWSYISAIEQSMMNTLSKGSIASRRGMLCSGANLAFRREWFIRKAPFKDNMQIFSGDDLSILESAGSKVGFDSNPQSAVFTDSVTDARSFYAQRIRRAGKLRFTGKSETKIFGILSLLAGIISLTVLPGRMIFGKLHEQVTALVVLVAYLKVMFDASMAGNPFPEFRTSTLRTLITGYLYPIFVLFIPLLIFTVKPNWKGRRV